MSVFEQWVGSIFHATPTTLREKSKKYPSQSDYITHETSKNSSKENVKQPAKQTKKLGVEQCHDNKTRVGRLVVHLPVDTLPKVASNLLPKSSLRIRSSSRTSLNVGEGISTDLCDCDVMDYKVCSGVYAKYRVNVRFGKRHWTVHRRYRDFAEIQGVVQREFAHDIGAVELQLPPRRLITFNKFDPNFLAQRTLQLDRFAKTLIRNPRFLDHPAVLLFFSTSWNMVYNMDDFTLGRNVGNPRPENGRGEGVSPNPGLSPSEMRKWVESNQNASLLHNSKYSSRSSASMPSRTTETLPTSKRKHVTTFKPKVPFFHNHTDPTPYVLAHPRVRFFRGIAMKCSAKTGGTPAKAHALGDL
eukprot:CFRG1433T1